MIASFMLHALIVSSLCAGAAWLVDRALAYAGRKRRFAWAIGLFLSATIPLGALLFAGAPGDPALVALAVTSVPTPAVVLLPVHMPAMFMLPAMPQRPWLDVALAIAWAALSLGVIATYLLTSRRLARRARDWPRISMAHDHVLLAPDLGPAVFGLLRSRVVIPRWLTGTSAVTQQMALAHERQHVAARDPLLLGAALAVVACFPWNPLLLWQLRRLRFALEVDCDARVLASGADPTEYGEALLFVSQHATRAPVGAVALIERPSQLEQRIHIMTTTVREFRPWLTSALLSLAATCVLAATSVDVPAPKLDAPLKPTPNGGAARKLGGVFEHMLETRYPGLLEQDAAGTAIVVVLVNEDWSIAKTEVVMSPQRIEDIQADEAMFKTLGLAKESVPYVGAMGMQSPKDPARRVLIIYTERATPGKRFVSRLFPDTRATDRQIFRRYFPQAAKRGVPAGENVWVLLDREGHVLRSGQESLDPAGWNRELEARFTGIKTEGITVTAVTDDAGEPILDGGGKALQLNSVWLAPDSPPPAS